MRSGKIRDGLHYRALAEESQRVGWPTSFATDLTVHDRLFLSTRPVSDAFGWVLRTEGTHIIPAEHNGRHPAPAWPALIAEAFGAETCRFYFWNGTTLESLPDAAACAERLTQERERAA